MNNRVLAVLSLLAGILVLAGTWFFYQERIDWPNFHWYHWIQPGLMVLGGLLCFGAAIGYLTGNRDNNSKNMLILAGSMIPFILALRLVIVICVAAGMGIEWLADGASFEGFSFK
ncbi:hypothetical protein RB620_05455 [Paenibacillus sp. LHD-117]|uniref:hypothetical protein n=1 Tax=Paenibacillus sp. LHD-117 TaxID=3071412 RepID=UPI0027E103C9|nr:hypothetical protein [Paenibacillus sp. LHD-117]MDQ6418883.1 hypothetical protein [Paenibacillus sp. LHD-117]